MTSTARRVRQAVWTQEPSPWGWWAWCPCATPPPVPAIAGLDRGEQLSSWIAWRGYCETNSLGYWQPRSRLKVIPGVTKDPPEGWDDRWSGRHRLVLPSGYVHQHGGYSLPGRPRPVDGYGPVEPRRLPAGARVWIVAQKPGQVYRRRSTLTRLAVRVPAVVDCPLCRAPVLVERPDDDKR